MLAAVKLIVIRLEGRGSIRHSIRNDWLFLEPGRGINQLIIDKELRVEFITRRSAD